MGYSVGYCHYIDILLSETIWPNWNNIGLVWFMVFSTTFNNILVISWRSVLLVEKTEVPWENHRPVASHWQALSHNVVSSTHNFSGDKHWLHRYLEIQLPCDHEGPWNKYWRNDPLMVRTSPEFHVHLRN